MFAGKRWAVAAVALGLCAGLAGCNFGQDSSEPPPPSGTAPPPPPPPPPTNRAPTASAGADLVTTVGQPILLSAAGSTDPDGDTLTYSWNVVAGTGGGLAQPDRADSGFQATLPGTYIVEVTVRDPGNLSASDIAVVDVLVPRTAGGIALEKMGDTLIEGSANAVAVYLPAPAGAGGVTVSLANPNAAIVDVPATIDVPEGADTAAFSIEGLAAGDATLTVSAPGLDPAVLPVSVQARVLDLTAAAGGVVAGRTTTLTATLPTPAPAGGRRVNFSVLDAGRATVSPSQLDIAAGATEGTVTLTGTTPGSVRVVASTADGTTAPLRLMVAPVTSATLPSRALIDAAAAAGTITPEQATVYSVQAAFGAPELPAQFRGDDVGELESAAPRLANLRIGSMSPASQEAIAKYLFPPIYAGGWGESITPAQQKARVTPRPRAAGDPCLPLIRGVPRQEMKPYWKFIRTPTFKVWYPTVLHPDIELLHLYTAEENRLAAIRVAATVEKDFARLSAVLGDVLRDGALECNGGDDAIDIYVTRISHTLAAQVLPYLPGQCDRPGWMYASPDHLTDDKEARNLIAHELVHLFQLRYARPDCDDWRFNILDEATATWSSDFLRPNDNYEHRFLWGDDAWFDGNSGEWRASILETGNPGQRHCNGYCDYLFFEWLSRTQGPSTIRSVLDATASGNAQRAFETGLSGRGGGLEQLWPKFALFQWNDWQGHVYDDLTNWEGVRGASIRHGVIPEISYSVPVVLNGATKRDLGSAVMNKLHTLREGELPAMTTNYLHLRFTDPDVRRIHFEHKAQALRAQSPRLKVQALQKIDGQWNAVEDWSTDTEKDYCRDRRAERIEELVLVYSNSDAGTEPFLHSGPSVVQLYESDSNEPKLEISNASCMPWHGTTRVTNTNALGGFQQYTATVEFKLFVPPGEDPDEVAAQPFQMFVPASGNATAVTDWPDAFGCRQSHPQVQGPIGDTDGRLSIDFNSREVSGFGITTIPGATLRLECQGTPPIVSTGPIPSNWLSMGTTPRPLGQDGRTITGGYTETSPSTGVTTTYEWDLTAEPEE